MWTSCARLIKLMEKTWIFVNPRSSNELEHQINWPIRMFFFFFCSPLQFLSERFEACVWIRWWHCANLEFPQIHGRKDSQRWEIGTTNVLSYAYSIAYLKELFLEIKKTVWAYLSTDSWINRRFKQFFISMRLFCIDMYCHIREVSYH